jgi:hypothetical protein
MGGTSSSATISVVIEDSSFALLPGAQVKGRVYLAVHKEKVEAESLMLRITGGEYTRADYTTTSSTTNADGSTSSTTDSHSVFSSSLFLDLAFPLTAVQNGYFLRGHYEYPFIFTLPPGILPTMSASNPSSEGGRCEVKYEIEAKMHRRGWMKWDVKGIHPFIVLASPVPNIPSFSTYLPPVEYPLTFMCCYNAGNVRVGLSTENSLLAAGQGCDVNYVVQNNSTKRIKGLQLQLLEVSSWSAQGYRRSATVPLYSVRLEQGDLQFDLSPSMKNPQDSRTVGGYDAVITNPDILEELKTVLDSRRFRQPIAIPDSAHATMQGNLICVEHLLKLRVFTTFGTNNQEVSSKVIVHRCGLPTSGGTVANAFIGQNQQTQSIKKPSIYQTNQPSAQAIQAPQQLPPDWNAVIAEAAVIPTPYFATAVVVNEKETPGATEYTVAAPQVSYQGIANLFQILSKTYDQTGEFTKWCNQEENKVEDLTPEHFTRLFKVLKNTFDQITIVNQLAMTHSAITCAHIAGAITSCALLVKIDVAKKLSVKCIDKTENKTVVRDQLSPFEWMCVENCYN